MSTPTTLIPGVAEDIAPITTDGNGERHAQVSAYVPETNTLYDLNDSEQSDALAAFLGEKPTATLLIGPTEEVQVLNEDPAARRHRPTDPGAYDVAVLEPPTKPGDPVRVVIPSSIAVTLFDAAATPGKENSTPDIILMADADRNVGVVSIAAPYPDGTETISIERNLVAAGYPSIYYPPFYYNGSVSRDIQEALNPIIVDALAIIESDNPHPNAHILESEDPIFHAGHEVKQADNNTAALDQGLDGLENPDEDDKQAGD